MRGAAGLQVLRASVRAADRRLRGQAGGWPAGDQAVTDAHALSALAQDWRQVSVILFCVLTVVLFIEGW